MAHESALNPNGDNGYIVFPRSPEPPNTNKDGKLPDVYHYPESKVTQESPTSLRFSFEYGLSTSKFGEVLEFNLGKEYFELIDRVSPEYFVMAQAILPRLDFLKFVANFDHRELKPVKMDDGITFLHSYERTEFMKKLLDLQLSITASITYDEPDCDEKGVQHRDAPSRIVVTKDDTNFASIMCAFSLYASKYHYMYQKDANSQACMFEMHTIITKFMKKKRMCVVM